MKITPHAHADVRAAARWRGLDAFRGLAVIGMLLVNNPGDHDAVFAPLRHSAWHGCTLADLVFPFFLFVVGITTALTEGRPHDTPRIWRRAAVIFAIGILLNWFPFYQSGPIPWTDHPGFLDRVAERLLMLRIPGVLQRIAVAYLVAALLARRASSRAIGVVTAALLLGYWVLLATSGFDSPSQTLVAHVDRSLFDWSRWGLGNHLWEDARTWDPEGALSTISSISTVLLGLLCGRWIRSSEYRSRFSALFTAGLAATVAGWAWGLVFPFNKSLWTSSYVLYTAGLAAMVLAVLSAAIDRRPRARWARPLIVFGENPLIAYAGAELIRHILHSSIKIPSPGGRLGSDEWVTRALHDAGLSPELASLGWALLYVAAWWAVLAHLSRRRVLLRV